MQVFPDPFDAVVVGAVLYEQMADREPMASLIETLRDQGRTFTEIADHLNREGFRPVA